MNVYDIERLVKEGKMKLLFSGKEIRLCMTERLANELEENHVSEFANFAYTDYGSLYNGIFDYAVIRYVSEHYAKNEGCAIEPAGWGGQNMILYGPAIEWLRSELMIGNDTLRELECGLEDAILQYEWEGCCEDAKDLVENDENFKGCDVHELARIIEECNSGQSNTNSPDYSYETLLKRWNERVVG